MKKRKRLWIPEYTPVQTVVEFPTITLGGHYHVYLIDAETKKVKQELEFSNLITDAGLDFIGTGITLSTIYTTLVVGIDDTTPTISDIALGNEIADTTNSDGQADVDGSETVPVEFAFRRRVRQFNENEANGDLKELGWKVGSVVANRTLFKDFEGNLITIFKTDRDILKIVYEYRIFAPPNDITGSFIFSAGSGSVFYTIRPMNTTVALGWNKLLDDMGDYSDIEAKVHESNVFVDRTLANNPAPRVSETSSSFATYVPGTFFRDMTYKWDFSVGVFDNQINLVTWNPWPDLFSSGLMIWQMHLSSSIEKTSANRLDITFRQRWTRE